MCAPSPVSRCSSAERAYVLLLVVVALVCAWLTVSAAILTLLTSVGGPS